jgi:crotonobetainyl-CoA:carnitine CoA-transferase CaiB-like acyl-CoA transferase
VLNIAEIERDPHFAARQMVVEIEQPGSATPIRVAGVPIKLSRTPGKVAARGPLLGEHNEYYLKLAGLSLDEIAACLDHGAKLVKQA